MLALYHKGSKIIRGLRITILDVPSTYNWQGAVRLYMDCMLLITVLGSANNVKEELRVQSHWMQICLT